MKYPKLILFFIFIYSCSSEKDGDKNNNTSYSKIEINTKPNTLDFEKLFEWERFIFFNDKNILSSIYQIKYLNDSIIVLSFEDDHNGILIKNIDSDKEIYINSYGKGPGEFSNISNFCISDNNKMIYVFDEPSQKIIQYDLKGNFIKEFKSNKLISTQSFMHMAGNNFLIFGGNNYFGTHNNKLVRIDLEKDEVVDKFLPINKITAKYLFLIESDNFINNQYFHSSYDNFIYEINEKGINPIYNLDFGEEQLPNDILEREFANIMEFNQHLQKLNFAHGVSNFMMNNNLTFFTYSQSGELKFFLENKKTNTSWSFNKIENLFLNQNSEIKINYQHIPLGIHGSNFHFVVEPYELFKFFEKAKSSMNEADYNGFINKNKKWFELTKVLKKESNPFVVSFKLKK